MGYQIGDQPVPGYRLEQFLGQGSYGSVWKAVGPGGVPCALKFISLDNKSGMKEMRAIGLVKRLQHPNLCPVQALWLKDKEGNLLSDTPNAESTRFIQGGNKELIIAMGLGQKTLAQKLEEFRGRGGIPTHLLVRYMEDAAKGIDYLNQPDHDLGGEMTSVIHCDIKPANLLLVGGGVQVCDYGVARALSSTGDAIRKTFAAGTPAYASAELINNEPCNKTDQYALAITYVELRTGQLPFDEAKAIIANLTGQLDLSNLPPAEQEVIRQATSVDPSRRFDSCLDMVDALKMATGVTLKSLVGRGGDGILLPPVSGLKRGPTTPQTGSGPITGEPRLTPQPPVQRDSNMIRTTPQADPQSHAGGTWPPGDGPIGLPPLETPKSNSRDTQMPTTPAQDSNSRGARGTPTPAPPASPIPGKPPSSRKVTPPAQDRAGTVGFDEPVMGMRGLTPVEPQGFQEDPEEPIQLTPSGKPKRPREEPPEVGFQQDDRPRKSSVPLVLGLLSVMILLGAGGAAGWYFTLGPGKRTFALATTGETQGTDSPPTTTLPTKVSPPTENTITVPSKEITRPTKKDSTVPTTQPPVPTSKPVPMPKPVLDELRKGLATGTQTDRMTRLRDLASNGVDTTNAPNDEKSIVDTLKKAAKAVVAFSGEQTEKQYDNVAMLRSAYEKANDSLRTVKLPQNDAKVFDDSLQQTSMKQLERLTLNLSSPTTEDWKFIEQVAGASSTSNGLAKALEMEAKLAQGKPTAAMSSLTVTETDWAGFSEYVQGISTYQANAQQAKMVVEGWNQKFKDQSPKWLVLSRAEKMVAVVQTALELEPDNASKRKALESWGPLKRTVVKVTQNDAPFAPPSYIEVAKLADLFKPLRNPETAKIELYTKLYKEHLQQVVKGEGTDLIKNLPAGEKSQLADLYFEMGQHVLVNSVAWNAMPEMQADLKVAEFLAEKLFERSLSLGVTDLKNTWLQVACLLQTSKQVNAQMEAAASGTSEGARFAKLLVDRAKSRYPGTEFRDRGPFIEKLRKLHADYAALIPTLNDLPTKQLAIKQGVLQSLRLLDVDQSSYFRSEKCVKTMEEWTKTLPDTPDGYFLKAKSMQAYCKAVKPEGRFTREAEEGKPSYRQVLNYLVGAQSVIGPVSPDCLVAEAKLEFDSQVDMQQQNSGLNTAKIVLRPEEKKKIDDSSKFYKAANQMESYVQTCLLGAIRDRLMVKGQESGQQRTYELFTSGISFASQGEEAVWQSTECGEFLEQLVLLNGELLESKAYYALSINDVTQDQLSAKNFYAFVIRSTEKPLCVSDRQFLMTQQLLMKRSFTSGTKQQKTPKDCEAAIASIRQELKLTSNRDVEVTSQDQSGLSQLHLELGNLKLKELSPTAAFTTYRVQSRNIISATIAYWKDAYTYCDVFQPLPYQFDISLKLGTWRRFLADLSDRDTPAQIRQTNDIYESAVDPLYFAVRYYSPWNKSHCAAQVYYALAITRVYPKVPEQGVEETPTFISTQASKLVDASLAVMDAKYRIDRQTALEEYYRVFDGGGVIADIQKMSKDYKNWRSYIAGALDKVRNLPDLDAIRWKLALAELELTPGAEGSSARGSKLAEEWLPKLDEFLKNDTQLASPDRYVLERLKLRVSELVAKNK